MAAMVDNAALQLWETIAAAAGSFAGGLALALGRRAGERAREVPDRDEPEPAGDDLQREILAQLRKGNEATRDLAEEMRGLRVDWQAKREADEARHREQRDGLDDRLDDIGHALGIARRGNTEVRVLLRELIDRLPFRAAAAPADGGPERE